MSIGLTAQTVIPYVEEAQVQVLAVPGALTTLISNVPCIHAQRIDVVVQDNAGVALTALNLVFLGASGQVTWTVALAPLPGAGLVGTYTYTPTAGAAGTEAIGDSYSITANSGGATTATCWTAAR